MPHTMSHMVCGSLALACLAYFAFTLAWSQQSTSIAMQAESSLHFVHLAGSSEFV
jgi:hypothetical protein